MMKDESFWKIISEIGWGKRTDYGKIKNELRVRFDFDPERIEEFSSKVSQKHNFPYYLIIYFRFLR